jgi:hypothetical protein
MAPNTAGFRGEELAPRQRQNRNYARLLVLDKQWLRPD